MGRIYLSVLSIVVLFSADAYATDGHADFIRSHYAKFEYKIPMRDGIKLFTSVYIPYAKDKKYPILMKRTPYRVGPYGADEYKSKLGPSKAFDKEKYIFVFQDVRGKFMSEGVHVNMRPQDAAVRGGNATDDSTDTYDTIEWLLKNLPNHNGRVGVWGISYVGYYTSVASINAHDAIKAISPQAPIADWFFEDEFRNGVFAPAVAFIFMDMVDRPRKGLRAAWPDTLKLPTPDGYQFFKELIPLSRVNEFYFKGNIPYWNEIIQHPNYDDYWKAKSVLQHLTSTKPAALVVGGWYDTENLYGALATYQTMSQQNKKKHVRLVMGPWYHGQWNNDGDGQKLGQARFGFKTSDWYQKNIELEFFKYYLKSNVDKDSLKIPQVLVFETGANRWREFETWPPLEANKPVTLFMAPKETLSSTTTSQGGFSDYISDPNKPVPQSIEITRGWDRNYMTEDQRFAARRPDVLVFETSVLKEDVTIAGKIFLNLWFATNQTAADLIVKLVDVFPGKDENTERKDSRAGHRHELVRWGAIRGRFRQNFSKPIAFVPNRPSLVKFHLEDVFHTIKRGHKLQILVQSSMFPFLDINPQKYVENIFQAKEEDFVRATHKIFHSTKFPSRIEFMTFASDYESIIEAATRLNYTMVQKQPVEP